MAKKTRKHLYEGMYIINATLSDAARQRAVDSLVEDITARGGEMEKLHDWGRKRLAYEIDGKREGHYFVMFFRLPTQELKEMWREYHLNADLLRFSTLKADTVQETLEFKSLGEQ